MSPRRSFVAVVLAVCLLPALAAALNPLPPIDDGSFEPGVRKAFAQRLDILNRQLETASPAELSDLWGEMGQFLHAQRLGYAAEVAYDNAIELNPDQARWHYLRGLLARAVAPGPGADGAQ